NSLLDRFEEMCKGAKTPRPVLYGRVMLGQAVGAPPSLALRIINTLLTLAARAEQELVRSRAAELRLAWDEIEKSSLSGTRRQALSDHQLARKLTEYLQQVVRDCTVVLILEGFDQLRDDPSSKWLRDVWLNAYASVVRGLVIVITSETGLDELK